jgi:deoxyribose-phosphate aldolase
MEEIPGPQTFNILRERLVSRLGSSVPGFSPEYPELRSRRARQGQGLPFYIDHTLLKQNATRGDFAKLCKDAAAWKVWSVCVPSNRVAFAAAELAGSGVKVCTVAGFPWGYANTPGKVEETKTAIAEGAEEIDVVIPVGLLKDNDWVASYTDLRAVVSAAGDKLVKVILETSELSLEEKIVGAYLACFAGAGFLKTSTGFASGGASIDDIHILRLVAGERIGVKASGGVGSAEFAKTCIQAGADRIGTSSTGAILGYVSAKTADSDKSDKGGLEY